MEEVDRDRIEARAAEVLAAVPDYVWDGESLPVPVEAIADSCFDLLVRDVPLESMQTAPGCPELGEGASLSGLFLPAEREIWINAEEAREWPPRRRFTIGHELGHCVLHQDGQRSLFCRHGSIDVGPGRESAPATRTEDDELSRLIEQEANHFAAALLMPPEHMRRQYRATNGSFERLCEVFGASAQAMGRRLHQAVPRRG